MDSAQLQELSEITDEVQTTALGSEEIISLESEIPETLYKGMKEFLNSNPKWDQYKLMSSALANFLFQNGCDDRAVTEQYLNDMINLSDF